MSTTSPQPPTQGDAPTGSSASQGRRWPPWLGLVLLLALFELPSLVRLKGINPTLLRPTADLVLLVGLTWWSRKRLHARRWQALWVTWAVLLCVFRLDTMIFYLLMRQEPLLYDQVYMVRHAWVLIGDLWSPLMFAGLLGFVLFVVGVVFAARRSMRSFFAWVELAWVEQGREQVFVRRMQIAVALFAALGLVQTAIWGLQPKNPRHRFVRWESPLLVANVTRSTRIYRSIKRGLRNSPYLAYRDIELTRKPDLRLYLIESYGAVLATHPDLEPWWTERMATMQADLGTDGWHSASAFVRAPVSGGRSWLAEASILTGIRVRFEAEFHQVLDHIDDAPNLVSFLKAQGYNTVSLSPADRPRSGVKEVNYYSYDQRITYNDLDYRGTRWGWGIVPDEYSLGKADEVLINHDERPLFLNAHLVTSHAPWKRVPTMVGGWRGWQREDKEALKVDVNRSESRGVMKSVRLFGRRPKSRFMYEGKASDVKLTRFRVAIDYELDVLQERLLSFDSDALVIVMGDHQPPLVTPETANFAVPVHVFARDPALLEELLELGFSPGLRPDPSAPPIAEHQGLLSLFVRNLAACCSDQRPLPEARTQGLGFSLAD